MKGVKNMHVVTEVTIIICATLVLLAILGKAGKR
jgi:hypothetical protein